MKHNINKTVKNFTSWVKKLSGKTKIVIVVIIVLIIIITVYQALLKKDSEYNLATVKRVTIAEIVAETGNVVTAGKTDVYSPSKGIVEDLYVDNRDIVGIDQELFKVKSTATEDEKAATYASLTSTQSDLKTTEQAKLTLQTQLEQARKAVIDAQQAVDNVRDEPNAYTQLGKDSIDSALTSARWNFNAIEKKYVEADVAIGAAQAAFTKARLAYESTKDRIIKSPTIGTVSNLSTSIGDVVIASSGSSNVTIPGLNIPTVPPVLTIANFSSNGIVVKLNETDILNVRVGQEVVIDPDALKNTKYKGVVKRVDDIGTDGQGVVTYNVYIEILDADEKLKSGLTVDVDIMTKTVKNALSVPNSAVKPYQGGRAVRVVNQKTKEIDYVFVKTGIKDAERMQILEGLKEGQEIITSLTNEQVERPGLLGL